MTVSGGGPTPTGTVQFLVDGTDFGTAVTLAGEAPTSPSTTLLGAGNHTVEADYSGDSNYSANTGIYTQVVDQAPLSIVPDNLSRPVGQANPSLTYSFTGFVNGDNATTAGISGTANLTTTANTISPAGKYPITVTDAGTLSAANYDFPSAEFGYRDAHRHTRHRQRGLASSLPGSTYGQSVSFTVTVSGGGSTPTGTVQFLADGADFGSAVTLAGGSATSPSTKLLGAGNHMIEADYSGDSNYAATAGTFIQGVSKAHLTVTADAKSILYGDSVPRLTATISGFVNGDTSNVASGTPGLSTSAASASPVGAYPISIAAGTLSAANYDFPYLVNGILTVNKAHLTVTADAKAKVYGAALPTLTAALSGFVNGENSNVVSGQLLLRPPPRLPATLAVAPIRFS